MAVIALGLLEPANIAVLIELKKPRPRPDVIEKLMKRFIFSRGHPRRDAGRDARDHDQDRLRMSQPKLPPFTQIGMASLALIVAGGIYLSSHLPQHVPLGPAVALLIAWLPRLVTLYCRRFITLRRIGVPPTRSMLSLGKVSERLACTPLLSNATSGVRALVAGKAGVDVIGA